jgi:hypothetical protein
MEGLEVDRSLATAPADDESSTSSSRRRPDRTIEFALLTTYAIVVGATIWRHEMWRDELQAWTLTNSSDGLRDLLHNLRYEGHPSLWYLILFPLTRVTNAPEAMQVLQFGVSIATGWSIIRFAPFTLAQRALLLFGYFVAFEYGTLARSYGLGVLLVVGVCVAANRARRSWFVIGLALAFLALTSAFGAILTVALGAGLVVDELARRRSDDPRANSLQSIAIGATLAIGGVLVAYAQSIPPADAGEYRGWRTSLDAGEVGSTIASVWRAFVPVPQFQREFWNTNVLDGRAGIAAVLSIAIVGVVGWAFRHKPAAVTTWALGLGMMLVFLYAKIAYASSGRHIGHLFLLFVAMCWLAPSLATTGTSASHGASPVEGRAALLTVVLGLHVVAGAFAVVSDWATPFSDGRAVAEFINTERRHDSVIIGFPDTASSTVAGYLQRDVYFTQGGRFGNYIIWDTRRIDPAQPLAEILHEFASADGPDVLILRTEPLTVVPPDVELVEVFDDGIVTDEHFWLYTLRR